MKGRRNAVPAGTILTFALVAACAASARSATEFCPAQLIGPYAPSGTGSATAYGYRLRALSQRTVEGTIVAETERGWFSWVQAPVALVRTTYLRTTPTYRIRYPVAESPGLSVVFPEAVDVRRAWLSVGKTQGETVFGWDSHGTIECSPADFAAYDRRSDFMKRDPQPGDPTPAAAPPPATATPAAAPVPAAACARPFTAAVVVHAASPVFPDVVKNAGFSQAAVSVVYVAIDSDGKLVDAWTFMPSGYPALDASAIAAARASTYTAPVSYCRPVSGTYLFEAEFLPN